MVRKDAWNDFDFFEFIKFRFMAQDVTFADIEESLHPWHKAHLVMVYELFNVLLDSDC